MTDEVLIVDYSRLTEMHWKLFEKDHDCKIYYATSFESGGSILEDSVEEISYFIINIPDSVPSGFFDFVDLIKRNRKYKHTPLFILSITEIEEGAVYGIERYVNDYFFSNEFEKNAEKKRVNPA